MDANRALGLPDDCREYTSVRNILRDLSIKSVQVMVSCIEDASADAAAGVAAVNWKTTIDNSRLLCTGYSVPQPG